MSNANEEDALANHGNSKTLFVKASNDIMTCMQHDVERKELYVLRHYA